MHLERTRNSLAARSRTCGRLVLALVGLSATAAAQLDVQSWTLVDPYNRWSKSNPTPTSCRMDETASSSTVGPGWVVSNFQLPADATFEVTVQPLASGGDDDLVGIAFCYESNTQHLLLDWKRTTQSFNWGDPVATNDDVAEAGLKLKKIDGSWTRDGLWGGTDGLGVTTLAGPQTPGWVHGTSYVLRVELTPGRAVVRRDGTPIFDVLDSAVTAGRIAFFSFSQDDVVFSNVQIVASEPRVYCTAGTSTNGCVPSIGASGSPSVAASSGYVLTASGLEGQKPGLFFYGLTGAAISPWGGGTSFLCVKAPTQRMVAGNSGGVAGACDGTLASDWLAFVAANPTALGAPFTAGDSVHAQCWYRDPGAPKTTNLSDALEFVLVP